MHETTVEVILPARGRLPWIGDSLASLQQQVRLPDRVTLIDDGIEDLAGVERLGSRWLGSRFRVIRNSGRGISDALNTGIRASDADWIARMDADDVAHARRLADQLNSLCEASQDVLGCGTQVRQIDAQGRPMGVSDYPTEPESLRRELLQRSCFAHPTLVVRRRVLERIPYRSLLDGAEDVDLVLRLSEQGRLFNIDRPLLDYRLHAGQPNFRCRARQTALQELAFRLAEVRRRTGCDPLDAMPRLAEQFVTWRLSMPGYAQARHAMTALRYMTSCLRGRCLVAALNCAGEFGRARPWRPEVRQWIRRVGFEGPGSLGRDASPFAELNPGTAAGSAYGGRRA